MGIRLSVLLILTASIILFPLAFSSVDGYNSFEDGDFEYSVETSTTVSIISVLEDSTTEDMIVPSTVMHDDKEYTIVSIYATFREPVRTVHIPATVEFIDVWVFTSSDLYYISVDENNKNYCSVDGVIFTKDMRTLIAYPACKEGSAYDIPKDVTTIDTGAFCRTNLVAVVMPVGLKEIRFEAFAYCENLESINGIGIANELPSSVSILDSSVFEGCKKLTNLKLPDDLKLMGDSVFAESGIERINIPSGLYSMGERVFSDCPNLKSITSDNYKYQEEEGILYDVSHNKKLMAYPAASERTELYMDENVTEIEPMAFSGCSNLKKIVLPKTMAVINEDAFENCRSLEEIDLSNVSVVEYAAFNGCESLTNITFGEQITVIGLLAFKGTGLDELNVPSSVTSIGLSAFNDCKNLKKVTIPENSRVEVGYTAFIKSFNLTEFTIYSPDVILDSYSFDIGTEENPVTVTLTVPKDLFIPSMVTGDYTTLDIHIIGERPYPYENLLGVLVCVLVVLFIVRMFRGV
jgi:hypothetical protein